MKVFEFTSDEETRDLFKVALWCLCVYFDLEEQVAFDLLKDYYRSHSHYLRDDDYHHWQPFEIATRVYFFSYIKGTPLEYITWRAQNGYNKPPADYFAYLRETIYKTNKGQLG